MIATLTLNPALDYVVHTKKLNFGGISRSEKEEIIAGGKGINVSAVLSELGHETLAYGFIGGFTGAELEKKVRELGIRTDFIGLESGNTRINVKIRATEETDINASGPVISKENIKALFEKLKRLKSGDFLCLSGSAPKNLGDGIYADAVKLVSENGVKAVVDAEGKLLQNTIKYKPFLIKPNTDELEGLFNKKFETADDIRKAAHTLRELGAENVIVSMGKDGALLCCEQGDFFAAAPSGKVISTVGAGDSMVAGFLSGYAESGDMSNALRLGIAAGSATAFTLGTAHGEEIRKLYETVEVKKV